jgi:hypothetical protein
MGLCGGGRKVGFSCRLFVSADDRLNVKGLFRRRLGDCFFRPVEIDCRRKALLKQRQQILESGEHFCIDTAQSGVLF